MDPRDLIDIEASVRSFFEEAPGNYSRNREMGMRRLEISKLKGAYLFTLGSPGNEWDAIELRTGDTVKMFTDELHHTSMGLPGKPLDTQPQPPALRYFLLTPVTEEEEAMKLVGNAFMDRYIVVAMLLVDQDRYVPLRAVWKGVSPTDSQILGTISIITQLGAELTADIDNINKAPTLPSQILQLFEQLKHRELSAVEKGALIHELLSLNDIQFIEAVSRILARTLNTNTWFATQEAIAQRAYDIASQMPENHRKELRRAPWKSGVALPSPYVPKISFLYSKWDRKNVDLPVT